MKAVALIIVIGLITSIFALPVQVSAVDETWFRSYYPPANNATYYTITGKPYGIYNTDAPKIAGDDVVLSLGTASTGVTKVVKTNDFTDAGSWVEFANDTAFESVGHMPVPGATILSVSVRSYWHNQLGFPNMAYWPDHILRFSINGGSYYQSSAMISSGVFDTDEISKGWNVTGLATWTPELLNSTSLWASLYAYPVAGYGYYLDYLGFIVLWSAEVEGGGTGWDPSTPPEDEGNGTWAPNYWFIADEGGLIGILGFIGLIGMIATPALAVFAWRSSDDSKISIFVKYLATFVFCFAMFLAALTGT